MNEPSKRAALRLGYKHEGVWRAVMALPPGKTGARGECLPLSRLGADHIEGRKGTYNEDHIVRDNWWASVTWEDWDGGVREHIDRLMARR